MVDASLQPRNKLWRRKHVAGFQSLNSSLSQQQQQKVQPCEEQKNPSCHGANHGAMAICPRPSTASALKGWITKKKTSKPDASFFCLESVSETSVSWVVKPQGVNVPSFCHEGSGGTQSISQPSDSATDSSSSSYTHSYVKRLVRQARRKQKLVPTADGTLPYLQMIQPLATHPETVDEPNRAGHRNSAQESQYATLICSPSSFEDQKTSRNNLRLILNSQSSDDGPDDAIRHPEEEQTHPMVNHFQPQRSSIFTDSDWKTLESDQEDIFEWSCLSQDCEDADKSLSSFIASRYFFNAGPADQGRIDPLLSHQRLSDVISSYDSDKSLSWGAEKTKNDMKAEHRRTNTQTLQQSSCCRVEASSATLQKAIGRSEHQKQPREDASQLSDYSSLRSTESMCSSEGTEDEHGVLSMAGPNTENSSCFHSTCSSAASHHGQIKSYSDLRVPGFTAAALRNLILPKQPCPVPFSFNSAAIKQFGQPESAISKLCSQSFGEFIRLNPAMAAFWMSWAQQVTTAFRAERTQRCMEQVELSIPKPASCDPSWQEEYSQSIISDLSETVYTRESTNATDYRDRDETCRTWNELFEERKPPHQQELFRNNMDNQRATDPSNSKKASTESLTIPVPEGQKDSIDTIFSSDFLSLCPELSPSRDDIELPPSPRGPLRNFDFNSRNGAILRKENNKWSHTEEVCMQPFNATLRPLLDHHRVPPKSPQMSNGIPEETNSVPPTCTSGSRPTPKTFLDRSQTSGKDLMRSPPRSSKWTSLKQEATFTFANVAQSVDNGTSIEEIESSLQRKVASRQTQRSSTLNYQLSKSPRMTNHGDTDKKSSRFVRRPSSPHTRTFPDVLLSPSQLDEASFLEEQRPTLQGASVSQQTRSPSHQSLQRPWLAQSKFSDQNSSAREPSRLRNLPSPRSECKAVKTDCVSAAIAPSARVSKSPTSNAQRNTTSNVASYAIYQKRRKDVQQLLHRRRIRNQNQQAGESN